MAKKQFKAESKRLLDLMINSIYTHKEIFLRELISNASDAIDKLCYMALTDRSIGLDREDFFIRAEIDSQNRLLKISDNGIGMNREDLENNLGVIAHSGSLQFKSGIDAAEKNGEIDIIGQFGVGFYSAFMVSDEITVISRKFGDAEGWIWKSAGADGYTVTGFENAAQGTEIIMKIKEDAEDEDYGRFLNENSVSSLIRKYSDYIRYPIQMELEKRRNKNEGEKDKTPEWESYRETETINSRVPLWQRGKSEIKDEDTDRFYQEKFFDFEKPLKTIHVDAEGIVNFKALLFIPSKTSYDYYTQEYKKGLQLYSNGVLVMENCEDLLPDHFRFVKGVVDSPDVSLNVSRELLQQSRELKIISSNIERKILGELKKMLEDERENYETFWLAFGLQLKYGVLAEFGAQKDKLKDLLLFVSSENEKPVSLSEYVSRMKDGQKNIYYSVGETVNHAMSLPQAEFIRQKGYEVLYFTDSVDEFMAQVLMTFDEKPIKSVNDDDSDTKTDEQKKTLEKQSEEYKPLFDFIKDTVKEDLKDVRISEKLQNQPVALSAEGPLSIEMEKYLNQMQPDNQARAARVLELNAEHHVIKKLRELVDTDKDLARTYAEILYRQAEMMAGISIADPFAYSALIFGLM